MDARRYASDDVPPALYGLDDAYGPAVASQATRRHLSAGTRDHLANHGMSSRKAHGRPSDGAVTRVGGQRRAVATARLCSDAFRYQDRSTDQYGD